MWNTDANLIGRAYRRRTLSLAELIVQGTLFAAAVAAFSSAVGCAAITTGTNQDISLATEPPGARCEVERNETVLGSVPSTPGQVTVTKSPSALTIRCEKPGFEPASGFLFASFQERTYWGGAIGVMIDMQSGAVNQYPSSITIILVPTEFKSAEARNDFFAKFSNETRRQAESDIASIRDQTPACKTALQEERCADAVEAREEQLSAELDQIEQRRQRARIVGGSTQ